jgi:hypothetical protein
MRAQSTADERRATHTVYYTRRIAPSKATETILLTNHAIRACCVASAHMASASPARPSKRAAHLQDADDAQLPEDGHRESSE